MITPEAFYVKSEGGEHLPDLSLFPVVHVHIKVGRSLGHCCVDQSGTLHFEPLALDDDPPDELRESGGRERLLQDDVIALNDHVGGVHEPVGQVAIRGENDETLAVEIEASRAEEPELGKFAGK